MIGAGLERRSGLHAVGPFGTSIEPDAEFLRDGGIERGFEFDGLKGIPVRIQHFDTHAGVAP